jgi:hypothetical protein
MKLTEDEYINENIKLSLKNTDIVLKSIEKNLNTIREITHQIQNSKNSQESVLCLTKIKEISIESIIEKCNMLKAAIDRFTIPYEDVDIPKLVKYIETHEMKEIPPPIDLTMNKRFRDKISRNNMPIVTSAAIDDDGCDCDN